MRSSQAALFGVALCLGIALAVAACGSSGTATTSAPPAVAASTPTASAGAPATPPSVAPAPSTGAVASAPAVMADPGCAAILTLGELGTISKRDDWALTSDDDDMPDTDVTCQWDRGELYSTNWQHLDVNLWSGSQAARFIQAGLPGDAVALGDGAAWDEIGSRLLVKVGDRVLGIDPGVMFGDTVGSEAALAMAGLVLPRLGR